MLEMVVVYYLYLCLFVVWPLFVVWIWYAERVFSEMSKQNTFPSAVNTLKTTDDLASVLRFFVNLMLKGHLLSFFFIHSQENMIWSINFLEPVAEAFQKSGGIEALSFILPNILQKKDKESISLVFLLINNLLILTKRKFESSLLNENTIHSQTKDCLCVHSIL